MRNWKAWIALAFSLGIALGVGALGAWTTEPNVSVWYAGLNRPAFAPPHWLFGPVWTVLYILMAVAAWLVWLQRDAQKIRGALSWYFLQLLLNLGWSFVFFGMHRPDLAFLDILILWLAIGITFLLFRKVRPAAGYLFLPYWLWVSFAAVLNFAFWRLNPGIVP